MLNFSESPKEECGVIGIFAPNEDVARMAFFGLYALQHRGQEAAGIAVADGRAMSIHKGVGLVSQVFTQPVMERLNGHYAIGHTRYSTTGSSSQWNFEVVVCDWECLGRVAGTSRRICNATDVCVELCGGVDD